MLFPPLLVKESGMLGTFEEVRTAFKEVRTAWRKLSASRISDRLKRGSEVNELGFRK